MKRTLEEQLVYEKRPLVQVEGRVEKCRQKKQIKSCFECHKFQGCQQYVELRQKQANYENLKSKIDARNSENR